MALDGWSRVTAVDYSQPCIEAMRAVQGHRLKAAAVAAVAAVATVDTAAAAPAISAAASTASVDTAAAAAAIPTITTAAPPAGAAAAAPPAAALRVSFPPCEIDYCVMDVTAMTYPDASLDCVVDKA
jgi:hypothetical protein